MVKIYKSDIFFLAMFILGVSIMAYGAWILSGGHL
jgi:hypothetical protein